MSDQNSGIFREFIKPPLRIPRWLYVAGVILSTVAAAVCFTQTEMFESWLKPIPDQTLHDHIRDSVALQEKVAQESGASPQECPIESKFPLQRHTDDLNKVYNYVIGDAELEKRFNYHYGTSFKKIKIIAVPAWELSAKGYSREFGITEMAGWNEFLEAKTNPSVDGVTIRERPEGNVQRTVWGTTVVILKESAFASPRSLRFAFFHELVHAMNIPGYRYKMNLPYFGEVNYTRGQTDLAYIEEYRWFIAKEGWHPPDSYTFGLFAGIFLLITFLIPVAWLLRRNERRR